MLKILMVYTNPARRSGGAHWYEPVFGMSVPMNSLKMPLLYKLRCTLGIVFCCSEEPHWIVEVTLAVKTSPRRGNEKEKRGEIPEEVLVETGVLVVTGREGVDVGITDGGVMAE